MTSSARCGRIGAVCRLPVLVLAVLFATCMTAKKEDLGHGYRLVTKRVESRSFHEKYAYLGFLEYRGQHLGEVGEVSISPSGRFALYEQDGKLLLFDAGNHSISDVTDGEFVVPDTITWREAEGFVIITYYDREQASRIDLPG